MGADYSPGKPSWILGKDTAEAMAVDGDDGRTTKRHAASSFFLILTSRSIKDGWMDGGCEEVSE